MPSAEPSLTYPSNTIGRYLLATRPGFLGASAAPVFIGLATAYYTGLAIDPLRALLCLVGIVLIHAGINAVNDYYDAQIGTDAINTERVYPFTGGSRFIQNGVFTPTQMGNYGLLLLLAGGTLGLVLAWLVGPELLMLGAIGLLLGWGYSAPPLLLAGRGVGELAVALGFGVLIPVGADFVQRETWSTLPLWAGVPYALLVANILYINQFPDFHADAATGKHHWVVRLGLGRARFVYSVIMAVALAVLIVGNQLHVLPDACLLTIIAFVPAAVAARQLLSLAGTPARLAPAIRLTITAALAYGLLMTLGLVIAAPGA